MSLLLRLQSAFLRRWNLRCSYTTDMLLCLLPLFLPHKSAFQMYFQRESAGSPPDLPKKPAFQIGIYMNSITVLFEISTLAEDETVVSVPIILSIRLSVEHPERNTTLHMHAARNMIRLFFICFALLFYNCYENVAILFQFSPRPL